MLCFSHIAIGQITDKRDGKSYKTIKIGSQVWMAENLAYKPGSGNYWAYGVDSSNVAKYGYLYEWETAKNVCPFGWHLPSEAEWTTLTDYLGGEDVAGTKMKSTSGWKEDGNGTNESGFNGLPGGFRGSSGSYSLSLSLGSWWSSSQSDSNNAWARYLYYAFSFVSRHYYYKAGGLSVRCIKD